MLLPKKQQVLRSHADNDNKLAIAEEIPKCHHRLLIFYLHVWIFIYLSMNAGVI